MTPEHQRELGFEQPMPGVTGEVTRLTPSNEQLEKLQAAAQKGVKTARNDLAAIEVFVGDPQHVDATVADFVRDEGGMAGALVGFEGDIDHPGSRQTEEALYALPPETVHEAAATELLAGEPEEVVVGVLQRLDDAGKGTNGLAEQSQSDISEGKTSQGVHLAESLRRQREKIGYARSSHDAEVPRYDTREAEAFLAGPDCSAKEAIVLIEELFNSSRHQNQMNAEDYKYINKKDVMDATVAHDASNILYKLSPNLIRSILQLPRRERGVYDHMAHLVSEAYKGNKGDVAYKKMKARLEGFASLTEKRQAMLDAGQEADREVTLLDTYTDFHENTPTAERQQWAHEYLVGQLGYAEVRAAECAVAMRGRIIVNPENPTSIDPQKHLSELEKITQAVQEVGSNNIATLREICGIVNSGEMSADQLHRMVRFAEGDPSLAEELAQKEVCVIIRDETSDWNGAFRGLNEEYETTSGATLIFGVPSLRDQGEHLRSIQQRLKVLGIRPSVLILAGHGRPGVLHMGDGYIVPQQLQRPQPAAMNVTTLEQAGIDKIIADMKPDRDGNCSIIYEACSQGANIGGVQDETTLVRTAKIARDQGSGNVFQIFGTDNPSNARRNKFGNIYDSFSGGEQPITRVTVGQFGGIYRSTNAEVQLPMFRKPVIDLRKPQPGITEVAA
ncbi:MAG: hypothetical protein WAU02_01545 [Candidatus Saccharimonadales bacterium]